MRGEEDGTVGRVLERQMLVVCQHINVSMEDRQTGEKAQERSQNINITDNDWQGPRAHAWHCSENSNAAIDNGPAGENRGG